MGLLSDPIFLAAAAFGIPGLAVGGYMLWIYRRKLMYKFNLGKWPVDVTYLEERAGNDLKKKDKARRVAPEDGDSDEWDYELLLRDMRIPAPDQQYITVQPNGRQEVFFYTDKPEKPNSWKPLKIDKDNLEFQSDVHDRFEWAISRIRQEKEIWQEEDKKFWENPAFQMAMVAIGLGIMFIFAAYGFTKMNEAAVRAIQAASGAG